MVLWLGGAGRRGGGGRERFRPRRSERGGIGAGGVMRSVFLGEEISGRPRPRPGPGPGPRLRRKLPKRKPITLISKPRATQTLTSRPHQQTLSYPNMNHSASSANLSRLLLGIGIPHLSGFLEAIASSTTRSPNTFRANIKL